MMTDVPSDTDRPAGNDAAESTPTPAESRAAEPVAGPEAEGGRGAATAAAARPMHWYVLRVASNREEQVRDALARKVKIEGLEERVGRVLVPTQREKRMKGGQARLYDRKLYPGYVFVEMATEADGTVSEDVWFVVKDTSGVGDFIGSENKPTEMKPHDVEKMLSIVEKSAETPTLAGMAGMKKGDLIKIKEGAFVTIFGRATPIELEYWQVERL
jgi:transcriptional antiterminator NusG